MKRFLIALAAASTLMLSMVPAHATDPTVCHTYTSPSGDKKVKVCTLVLANNNGAVNWWARITYDNVPGNGMPYAMVTGTLIFWNAPTGTSNWCEGKAPGCNGTGDGGGLITTPSNHEAQNTDHYAPGEHYCSMHSQVVFLIYWTQNHYNNNDWDVGDGFNSGSQNAGPNCIGN